MRFDASPFNAVDALILCQLSYLDFTNVVPSADGSAICLRDAAERHGEIASQNVGLVINEQTAELFFRAASSARFSDVMMCGAVDKYSEESEEQFCAVTFVLNKDAAFVAFRGTDDTIVGWKEDFNLAFMTNIPAQKDALAYLESAADDGAIRRIYVGGHSKGGNLALFAAANLAKNREKLIAIYNFDGPGFLQETLSAQKFRAIEPITQSYYPQLSIIGQLFAHFPRYTVVKSSGQFLMQHDPFTWHLAALGFCEKAELEAGSAYFYKTFNEWFATLEKKEREEVVNALFAPLSNIDYKNLSALSSNWLDASVSIMKAINAMNPDVKNETWKVLSSIFPLMQKNIATLIAQK